MARISSCSSSRGPLSFKAYKSLTGFDSSRPSTSRLKIIALGEEKGIRIGTAASTEAVKAVSIISKAWTCFQRRKVFMQMKSILVLAETGLTLDMLKKICPKEIELLLDPFSKSRVRFRFGGESFPPKILFKIYSKGLNVHYFNGRQIIEPGSKAASDSCAIMGPRRFTEQVILTNNYLKHKTITDPVDVTCKQDHTKYMALLDHIPTYIGGRNNEWREISFKNLPSHRLFYDFNMLKRTLAKKKTIIEAVPRNKNDIVKGLNTTASAPSSQKKARSRALAFIYKNESKAEEVNDDELEISSLFEWATELSDDIYLESDYKHGLES